MESSELSKTQRLKKGRPGLLTVAVSIVSLWTILSVDAETFIEQFDSDNLDTRVWNLYKGGDKGNKIFPRDGKLNVHALGANTMFPDIDDSIKLLMKKPPKDNWTITTAIEFNTDPQGNWSGIVVYDATNQPSTDWLCLWVGHTGTSIVMRGLSGNALTPRKTILFVNKEGAELRMDKEKDLYTAFFRALGADDWREVGQLKIQMPESHTVGLVTNTLADHKRSETNFDYFTISSEGLKLEEIFAVNPENLLTITWGRIKTLQ